MHVILCLQNIPTCGISKLIDAILHLFVLFVCTLIRAQFDKIVRSPANKEIRIQ